MYPQNQFRSKPFIKIKHTIEKATSPIHLPACRQMIENCTPICSKEEVSILKQYLMDAWDRLNPVGESFADEIDSILHKRLAAN